MTQGQLDTASGGNSTAGFTALAQNAPTQEDEPYRVHGVAIGEGDITQGVSGDRVYWPAEALEPATDDLVGKKIVTDRDHEDLEKTQPSVDTIVGEVTNAKYDDGVGIVYEGEIDDEEIAKQVERGRIDVSPMLFRHTGEYDEERDAKTATGIAHWRDLAAVAEGASESASINPGAATAMQATALRATFADEPAEPGTDSPDDDPEGASTGDSDSDSQTTMELTEAEEALVRKSRTVDSPTVVGADAESLLNDAEQYSTPKLIEESEHEALQENVETIRGVLAEALTERTGMKEETAEALTLGALVGEFKNEDGEFEADALTQTPEAGGADDDDDPAPTPDSLSADQRSEIKSLVSRAETFDTIDDSHAESLRSEAADVAGVDEFGDLDMEAL